MTPPENNQKTKLPERWDVKGSYLSWDGVAEVQVHCNEISHAHACRLAEELARRWNLLPEIERFCIRLQSMKSQDIRLICGEISASELRAASAMLKWAATDLLTKMREGE